MKPGQIRPLYLEPRLQKQSVKQKINNHGTCLAKPLHTLKKYKKCLADNRTAKYEVSVGPAENLPPTVRRIPEFISVSNMESVCQNTSEYSKEFY
jgi:hypothetical protein